MTKILFVSIFFHYLSPNAKLNLPPFKKDELAFILVDDYLSLTVNVSCKMNCINYGHHVSRICNVRQIVRVYTIVDTQ